LSVLSICQSPTRYFDKSPMCSTGKTEWNTKHASLLKKRLRRSAKTQLESSSGSPHYSHYEAFTAHRGSFLAGDRLNPLSRQVPAHVFPGRWPNTCKWGGGWPEVMRNSPPLVHVTVRRASISARYRLWAELDGDFGVVLARSNTLVGLRRNAARAIRKQWSMGYLDGTRGRSRAGTSPKILWHRSSRAYARLAGRDLSTIRKRWRESVSYTHLTLPTICSV